MAEFGMWGPAQSGTRLAQQDQQASLLNDLGAVETMGKIQAQPAQRALAEAHARLYGAEAESKEMDAAARRKVMERMSSLGDDGTDADGAKIQRQLGMLYLRSGMVEQGRKLLEGAEMMDTRAARQVQLRAAAANQQLTTQSALLEKFGLLARGVTDQESLNRSLMLGAEMASSIEDPATRQHAVKVMQSIPKDYAQAKPVLEQLLNSTKAGMDSIRADQREHALAIRESNAATARDALEARRVAQDARNAADEARRAARERAGGGHVAKTDEVVAATTLIRDQLGIPKGNVEGLTAGAYELVDAARAKINANPALTFTQALHQAYDPDDWIQPPKVDRELLDPSTWGGGGGTPRRAKPGETAKRALPLPASKDPKELKEGAWYTDGSKAMKWTGKAFE